MENNENLINTNSHPQNPTSVDGICPQCQSPLTLPFPPIVFFHHVTVDMISIPHTQGVTCRCGLYYNIVVVNIAVNLGLMAQEKPVLNEDKLVQPVSNLIPFKSNRTGNA